MAIALALWPREAIERVAVVLGDPWYGIPPHEIGQLLEAARANHVDARFDASKRIASSLLIQQTRAGTALCVVVFINAAIQRLEATGRLWLVRERLDAALDSRGLMVGESGRLVRQLRGE